MDNVEKIFPADEFSTVASNAAERLEFGLILGYDSDGKMVAFGGGTDSGRRPVQKDWLWLVQHFQHGLITGVYYDGDT